MIDVGTRIESVNCGWTEVMGVSDPAAPRGGKYLVRFDNSGNEKVVAGNSLATGNVSDTRDIAVGEIFNSNSYGKFELVNYENNTNITVRFFETGNTTLVQKDAVLCGYVTDTVLKAEEKAVKDAAEAVIRKAQREAELAMRAAKALADSEYKARVAAKKQSVKERAAATAERQRIRQATIVEHFANADRALDEVSAKDIQSSGNVLHNDFKDREGNWVLRFSMNGDFIQTRLGKLHNNVTQRAKKDGSFQVCHNTYKGVSISEEFLDAQRFCDWAVQQPGWGMGYCLEKDLVLPGNKTYCAEACVFVPHVINYAIVHKTGKSVINKVAGGWAVRLTANNLRVSLGVFPTEQDAYKAYYDYRTEYVKKLAKSYKNFISERAYEALLNWSPS